MAKKKLICLITQSHLCRNPRVLKEAITLADNGYHVHILTCLLSKLLEQEDLILIKDQSNIVIQWVVDLTKKNLATFIDRALFKLGRSLIKHLKVENSLALGYGSNKYFITAKSIRADLYCCHQELATFIGTRLIESGFKVSFDIEDWYSTDLLLKARQSRPIKLLEKSECIALDRGAFCTTTSAIMANKLNEIYKSKEPTVIYNVFPLQSRLLKKKKQFNKPLKLFWFSQTIGPGRGLEEFIYLLVNIGTDAELHLLGNVDPAYQVRLQQLMFGKNHLAFHSLVSDRNLPLKISSFDIGLALELTNLPSRNYTITNKFFQYLQSGLPVIATKTAGQLEAFEKFKPGLLITPQDSILLKNWLNDVTGLEIAATEAKTAAQYYCWENESKKLLKLINNALGY